MIKTKNTISEGGFLGIVVLLVTILIFGVGYFAAVHTYKKPKPAPISSTKKECEITKTYKTSSSSLETYCYTPDQKRKADISGLHTQLVSFYSTWGYYPSLTDMNSADYQASKMTGISTSLTDPDNQTKSQILASQPTKNQYSYQVTDKSGSSCEADSSLCAKYTFTAILSDGSLHQRGSPN